MQIRKNILRLLCAVIDFIIVMMPIQFVMMGIFGVSQSQADLLFKFLFAVYGALLLEYMGGRTIGKWAGQLVVVDNDSEADGKNMLYLGIRELSKSLYFIPYIGWAICLISIIMMFYNGRSLHDVIGGTKVLTATEVTRCRKQMEEQMKWGEPDVRTR